MIKCPLMDGQIEDSICFDISMVSEHLAPNHTMPIEVREIKNYEEICLKCQNHRED